MTASPFAGAAGFAGVWHRATVDRHRLPATQAAVIQNPVFIASSNLLVGNPPPIEGPRTASASSVRRGCPPSAFEMSAMAFWAFTLLPASSRGGEMTAIPNLPGETAMMPPPTPLLPGSPVRYSHLPESS